jgi:hypothetical protein
VGTVRLEKGERAIGMTRQQQVVAERGEQLVERDANGRETSSSTTWRSQEDVGWTVPGGGDQRVVWRGRGKAVVMNGSEMEVVSLE